MNVRRRARAALVGVCGTVLAQLGGLFALPQAARADVITSWNQYLLDEVIKPDNRNPAPGQPATPEFSGDKPPAVSRQLAMIHAAMFDAVNAVDGRYQPYLVAKPTGAEYQGANAEVAAMWAAHDVAAKLFENSTSTIRSRITQKKNQDLLFTYAGLSPATLAASQALGKHVAERMLAHRANDNASKVVPYTDDAPNPGSTTSVKGFGKYRMDQFSNGAQVEAAGTNWPEVTPFALQSPTQFRKAGPPGFKTAEYAAAVNEIRVKGDRARYDATKYAGGKLPADVMSDLRTAFFWAEKGLNADGTKTTTGTITPPGHWNHIATVATANRNLGLSENARMYAMLNIAMADAAVAAWDMKYANDLWRPIHAIRLAATDPSDPNYNPGIVPDAGWATWLPIIPTSNHPEYVSGHSTFSGAAAQILTQLLGEQGISFTITSDDALAVDADGDGAPDVGGAKETRTFTRFWDAAEEAGRSRIYGGIHYQFSNLDGLQTGREIGDYVFANTMAAVPEPAAATVTLVVVGLVAVRRGQRRRS